MSSAHVVLLVLPLTSLHARSHVWEMLEGSLTGGIIGSTKYEGHGGGVPRDIAAGVGFKTIM